MTFEERLELEFKGRGIYSSAQRCLLTMFKGRLEDGIQGNVESYLIRYGDTHREFWKSEIDDLFDIAKEVDDKMKREEIINRPKCPLCGARPNDDVNYVKHCSDDTCRALYYAPLREWYTPFDKS